MKRLIALAVFVVLGNTAFAQESIRNFLRVNEDFCTAGQPTNEELAELKADGIVAVLNLRTPEEYDAAAEKTAVEGLGMKYFNIPVAGTSATDAQADQFLALTDDPANRPMFIHCASANRVGAFWMIRRVLRDDWDLERAQTEAEQVGLRAPALREFALNYISQHP